MNAERFLRFLNDRVLPRVAELDISEPIVLMDNARYHWTPLIQSFFSTHLWERLEQSPYSPDQQPCDSHGFRDLKRRIAGRRFASRQELIDAVVAHINEICEQRSFEGIYALPDAWTRIVDNNGDYNF